MLKSQGAAWGAACGCIRLHTVLYGYIRLYTVIYGYIRPLARDTGAYGYIRPLARDTGAYGYIRPLRGIRVLTAIYGRWRGIGLHMAASRDICGFLNLNY